jgi:hypothetical protein
MVNRLQRNDAALALRAPPMTPPTKAAGAGGLVGSLVGPQLDKLTKDSHRGGLGLGGLGGVGGLGLGAHQPAPKLPSVPCVDATQCEAQRADAARASRDILSRATSPLPSASSGDREVLADAPDVRVDAARPTDGMQRTLIDLRNMKIASQLEKNEPVVEQQLATLPPEDQQRFEEMNAILVKHGDDDGRLSLQTMFLENKLDTTTMTELHRLATSTKGAGVEPRGDDAVFRETVRELAVPDRIDQGFRGTCGATVPLIQLAREDPCEYARLVRGLSSPEGTVTTKGGGEIARIEDFADDDSSGRSTTQKLLAPALMEYANGKLASYDNTTDKHDVIGYDLGSGLYGVQTEALLETLRGRDYEQLEKPSWEFNGLGVAPTFDAHPARLSDVEQQLAQGKTVPVGMEWGDANDKMHGRHKVLVTGVTEENGQKYVEYVNPWGRASA